MPDEQQQPVHIVRPWVVVHQPAGSTDWETVLAGPPDAKEQQFAEVIASIVRNVAETFDLDERFVMDMVEKELLA